eukprot:5116576-Amphidinium_carterae.3
MWTCFRITSITPLGSNMFDDPSTEHAERYAIDVAPANGLTPREQQVMSPNRHDQMRERSQTHEPGTPRRRVPRTPTFRMEDHLHFHDLPQPAQFVPSTSPAISSEQLMAENAALRASRDPQALEAAQALVGLQ